MLKLNKLFQLIIKPRDHILSAILIWIIEDTDNQGSDNRGSSVYMNTVNAGQCSACVYTQFQKYTM